jgi:hypothetical protein
MLRSTQGDASEDSKLMKWPRLCGSELQEISECKSGQLRVVVDVCNVESRKVRLSKVAMREDKEGISSRSSPGWVYIKADRPAYFLP